MPIPNKWFESAKTMQEALGVLAAAAPHLSAAGPRAKTLLALNNAVLATDRDPKPVQDATIAHAKAVLAENREFLQGPLKMTLQAMLQQVDQATNTIDTLLNED